MSVWWQYVVPQHALSRLVMAATRVRAGWFRKALTRTFLRLFAVDLAEAAQPDPLAYPSFNAFFTRALRPGARPVAAAPDELASPVDGTLSECGPINGQSLVQAKGQLYTLPDLLAAQAWAEAFAGGRFATIYLAPYNYHRIHMPLAGELLECVYVPGRLFSVNSATAHKVPRLFARNERVLTLWDSPAGRFALIMVGALNVGSIATVWAGDIAPRRPRAVTRLPAAAVSLQKGAEVGRFNMGSTVILLFEPGRVRFDATVCAGAALRYGQRIGQLA